MLGLSDRERILMIRSAVLIQSTRVTDGRTDGIGVAYTRYSMYAVARKKQRRGAKSSSAFSMDNCALYIRFPALNLLLNLF